MVEDFGRTACACSCPHENVALQTAAGSVQNLSVLPPQLPPSMPPAPSLAPGTPQRIAVTTAVRFADKLTISLSCNRAFFTEYHIIHSPEDRMELAEICTEFNAFCHETNAFWEPAGAKFNKGRALAEVQNRLNLDPKNDGALIILIDADVCLPANFESTLPKKPSREILYGAPGRYIYCSASSLQRGAPDYAQKFPVNFAYGLFQAYLAPIDFAYP